MGAHSGGWGHKLAKWRLWLLLGLGVLLLLRIWAELTVPATQASSELIAPPSFERVLGDVRIWGVADHGAASVGETVRFTIFIENRGKEDLRQFRVETLESQGLSNQSSDCPVPSGALRSFNRWCIEGRPKAALPLRLRPGQSVGFAVELRAELVGEAGGLSGRLGWRDDAGAPRVHFSLGPILVAATPRPASPVAAVARAVYDFFKDLGVPISLALLAFLFQHLQQDRGKTLATNERLSQRAHENVVRYYLQLQRSASMFARFAGEYHDEKNAEKKKLALRGMTFNLVCLFKTNWKLITEAGGFFFRERMGENFLAELWSHIFNALRHELGYEEIYRACDRLQDGDTLTSFSARFEERWVDVGQKEMVKDHSLAILEEKIETWLGTETPRLVPVIDLFGSAVLLELNKLYEDWYDGRGDGSDLEQVRGKLGGLLEGKARLNDTMDDEKELRKGLERYRNDLEKQFGRPSGEKDPERATKNEASTPPTPATPSAPPLNQANAPAKVDTPGGDNGGAIKAPEAPGGSGAPPSSP